MDNERLVLNFLVYADRVADGTLQNDLLQEIAELGFSAVEIRREYFSDIEKEIPLIKSEAERLNLTLFYSVPDEVYVDGELNVNLEKYLLEASAMGVKYIKWNTGDFTGELHVEGLKKLLSKGIAISVENDQTQTSGRVAPIERFLKALKKEGLNIGYVYDLGNWRFVGEDEVEAAERLKDYVRYIHVKDVTYVDNKPLAAGLNHGEIDWQEILRMLPKKIPVAIEYPTMRNSEIIEAKKLLENMD